eukprot:COSAG04_NODE_16960_length_484_cov_0.566234_1_plen_140_part_01
MAGHGHGAELSLAAQTGGLLTDGMGFGGRNVSQTGQDFATVQAGAGQVAQLDLRALWMSQGNQLRVYVDGGEETLLTGTVLPPADGGGRRFRSKPGGKIELLNRHGFADIDVAMMAHPSPGMSLYPGMLAREMLQVSYHG